MQVSQANSAASDSPMIAAGIDAPFGNASGTFDPCFSPPDNAQRAQGAVRRQRFSRRAPRPKSAKNKNALPHESRLNLSPDDDLPAATQQVINLASLC